VGFAQITRSDGVGGDASMLLRADVKVPATDRGWRRNGDVLAALSFVRAGHDFAIASTPANSRGPCHAMPAGPSRQTFVAPGWRCTWLRHACHLAAARVGHWRHGQRQLPAARE